LEETPNVGPEVDRDNAILHRHMTLLREHFDSVQIFVTRDEGVKKGTIAAHAGCGDIFARYGHVRYWLDSMETGGLREE